MKAYFKYFAIPFVIVGMMAVAAVFALIKSGVFATSSNAYAESTNDERVTDERVFDYADLLTDAEEDSLRDLIAKREKETQCDIVIVNLNESLEDYAKSREDVWGYTSIEEYVLIYADDFIEEYNFGYDENGGNCILFLDNRYREADGYMYTRITTSGIAYEKYSDSDLERLEDAIYEDIDDDPYEAYVTFVEKFTSKMTGGDVTTGIELTGISGTLIASVIITVIYLVVNMLNKKGKKTTVSTTYVQGGRPVFRHRADHFIRKTVTQRRIESSSGGGGGGRGGSYRSSSGRSRGGSTGRR